MGKRDDVIIDMNKFPKKILNHDGEYNGLENATYDLMLFAEICFPKEHWAGFRAVLGFVYEIFDEYDEDIKSTGDGKVSHTFEGYNTGWERTETFEATIEYEDNKYTKNRIKNVYVNNSLLMQICREMGTSPDRSGPYLHQLNDEFMHLEYN